MPSQKCVYSYENEKEKYIDSLKGFYIYIRTTLNIILSKFYVK